MANEVANTTGKSDISTPTNTGQGTISERKLKANQANAKKSTGPRTPQGKAYSSANSLKHGLLAKTVLFDCNGKLVEPELLDISEELCEKYGRDDIRTRLLIDVAVTEYWRTKQAIAMEVDGKNHAPHFLLAEWIPQVQRYATASRNFFLKILDSLEKSQPARNKGPEAGEDIPQSDIPGDEGPSDQPESEEADLSVPAADSEIPQPSIKETGACHASGSQAPDPPDGVGPDEVMGAADALDREDVSPSNLHADECQSGNDPERTATSPTKPASDREIPQPSTDEPGAGPAGGLHAPDPPDGVDPQELIAGLRYWLATIVPPSDLPPDESPSGKPARTAANPAVPVSDK